MDVNAVLRAILETSESVPGKNADAARKAALEAVEELFRSSGRKAPLGERIYISDLVHADEMREFTYREDLDPDEEEPMRWPLFFTARDMEAVRVVLSPNRDEPITADLREQVEAALEEPVHHKTQKAKRTYVVQPPDTVLVRLTHGERAAITALAWGIDGGLLHTPDMEGVRAHLASKHKLLKKRNRKAA